jgi:RHS repeat-associated protein
VGTARTLVDGSATITDTYSLDAFRDSFAAPTGSTANPYRVGGAWGYNTETSGLQQLGARFYWQEIGRFISQDPIGDGINWYAYVGNNPITGIDPEGLHETDSMWHNLGHLNCTWVPGLKQGAKIVADKINPFGAPYYDAGMYDTRDPLINAAQTSAGVGVAAAATAGALAGAQALGVEVNIMSKGNVFKVISKTLKRGIRSDKAHHGKPWGHWHHWKW